MVTHKAIPKNILILTWKGGLLLVIYKVTFMYGRNQLEVVNGNVNGVNPSKFNLTIGCVVATKRKGCVFFLFFLFWFVYILG